MAGDDLANAGMAYRRGLCGLPRNTGNGHGEFGGSRGPEGGRRPVEPLGSDGEFEQRPDVVGDQNAG